MSNLHAVLKQLLGKGPAREGTRHFLFQRVTAISNIPCALFLVYLIVSLAGASRVDVKDAFEASPTAIFALLAFSSFSLHMYLGIQALLHDYVRTHSVGSFLRMSNILFCTLVASLGASAVLKLTFGG